MHIAHALAVLWSAAFTFKYRCEPSVAFSPTPPPVMVLNNFKSGDDQNKTLVINASTCNTAKESVSSTPPS